MCGPPDPKKRRGAGQGTPKSQEDVEPHQTNEVVSALQEKKFGRLYRQRTASAIAHAVNETAKTEQTRKVKAAFREHSAGAHRERIARNPGSIVAHSLVCQIDAIAEFVIGTPGRSLTLAELRQISDALWAAHQEAGAILSHRVMMASCPNDPKVDFG
jgi:hypothetical protein